MSTRDGGPAFPRNGHPDKNDLPEDGMSLRDWFAGQALVGIVAHPNGNAGLWKQAAEDAYKAADAMLATREEG